MISRSGRYPRILSGAQHEVYGDPLLRLSPGSTFHISVLPVVHRQKNATPQWILALLGTGGDRYTASEIELNKIHIIGEVEVPTKTKDY